MSVLRQPPSGPRESSIPPHLSSPAALPLGRSPLIEGLRADPSPSAVAAFWSEIDQTGTPLVEGSGARRNYTFLYRSAEEITAVPILNKLVDQTNLDAARLRRVGDTDVWALTLELGSRWRGSYQLAVVPADGTRQDLDAITAPITASARTLDRVRARRARSLAVSDPVDHDAVNAWYDLLEQARPDPLAREHGADGGSVGSGPRAPGPRPAPTRQVHGPGRLIPVAGEDRAWWYLPQILLAPDTSADPAAGEVDVLVLLDGDQWAGAHDAAGAEPSSRLDLLWQRSLSRPTIGLLYGHDSLPQRVAELTCTPATIDRLVDLLEAPPAELLEGVAGARVTTAAARTTIAGQSLGGLTAVYAQALAPHRFGFSVSQSGSFWWPNAAGGTPAEWLTGAIERADSRFDRVHLEVGTAERALLGPTDRMRRVMQDRCRSLRYLEFDGGHDRACWQANLPWALAGND